MIRFIDVLGRNLSKPRVRQICEIVELNKTESGFILARCCDGQSYDQIADLCGIPIKMQRTIIAGLNNKVELWLHLNPQFLSPREFGAINAALAKYGIAPIES